MRTQKNSVRTQINSVQTQTNSVHANKLCAHKQNQPTQRTTEENEEKEEVKGVGWSPVIGPAALATKGVGRLAVVESAAVAIYII